MTRTPIDPRAYLSAPVPSFWTWDGKGETVTWPHGETLAFRPEIEQVLRALATDGLPPLSLVLLVLAACRESWTAAVAQPENLVRLCAHLRELELAEQKQLLDGLMRVSQLPSELRHPIEAKAGLARFLFEVGQERTSAPEAEAACDALLGWDVSARAWIKPNSAACRELRAGLEALLQAFERFDAETFRLRHQTGLDQLVLPAELAAEPPERAWELVSALQDDRQLQGLARLARALMAVVHLPRPILEPDELPLGGFSDIANRGPLDRLLVSELAHDNLTLAVRVALNEALYLRREAPPKTPPQQRSILIDAGIRLWGVPRVFATAVALALASTTDRHASVSAYRAQADRIERIDWTRQGLVEHLAAIETDPHPGRALDAFLARTGPGAAGGDCIIVTSSDAAADREFQRHLERHQARGLYLATVHRNGEFRLVRQGPHAQKTVCEAKLALEDLLRPRRRPTVPLVDGQAGELPPAILRSVPFPLRVPSGNFNSRRSWVVPELGAFEIASDGRLLLWEKRGWGPRQIAEHVPGKASVCWSDPRCREGRVTAVLGESPGRNQKLLVVDIGTGHVNLFPLQLDERHNYTLCGHGGMLFGIARTEVCVLSATDGRWVQTWHVPQQPDGLLPVHCRDRFFRSADGLVWYALAHDGRTIYLDTIVARQPPPGEQFVAMFDWVGHEGPIGVTNRGRFYYPDEGRMCDSPDYVEPPVAVRQVSSCGGWLLADSGPSRRATLIEVATRRVRSRAYPLQREAASPWVCEPGRLRRRFAGIVAGDEWGLALVSRKGWCWSIRLHEGRLRLQQSLPMTSPAAGALVRPFERTVDVGQVGYSLRMASWPDGSRAYLDSRGLLHLRSSDADIPEVSLVLADAEIAGWCSDGRLWGARDYIGDRADAEPRQVFEDVIQPFLERLP